MLSNRGLKAFLPSKRPSNARGVALAAVFLAVAWLSIASPPHLSLSGSDDGAHAFDADPPEVEYLGSFKQGLFQPIRIACDEQGRYYVTETGRGEVRVFSHFGNVLDVRKPGPDPLSIAVDSRTRIYVGFESGGMKIYDYTWREVGSFGYGDGPGKLLMPSDIAIDPLEDRLYVTDSKAAKVKVFSLSGDYLFSFGEGLGFPSGVAVDVGGRRVIVGDHSRSSVHVFNVDGDSVFSYGRKGSDLGEMVRVQGVCVDGHGRMYVTDAYLGVVQVYDPNGVYLASIGGLGNEPGSFRQPMDLVIDAMQRLVVVSANTSRLELFSVGDVGRGDGPTTPALIWPNENEEIFETRPVLVISRAYDINDVDLAYDIEVYRDEWLDTLVVSNSMGGDIRTEQTVVSWELPTDLTQGENYWWRARAADPLGPGSWSPMGRFRVRSGPRYSFYMAKIYPNPFSSNAVIRFGLEKPSFVDLRIFDVMGRQVRVLNSKPISEGDHAVEWNGRNDEGRKVDSGIYFCRLSTGGFVKTRKLVFVQ